MKVIKITNESGRIIVSSISDSMDLIMDAELGKKYTFETMEMLEEDFNSLPATKDTGRVL